VTEREGNDYLVALWPPQVNGDAVPTSAPAGVAALIADLAQRIAIESMQAVLLQPARCETGTTEHAPNVRRLQRDFPTEGGDFGPFTPNDWILATADCLIIQQAVPEDDNDLPAAWLRLLAAGLAIIAIPPSAQPDQARVLWRGFAPGADVLTVDPCRLTRPYETGIAALMGLDVSDEQAAATQAQIDAFLRERLPAMLIRTEYPLLLMVTAGRIPRTGEFLPRRAAKSHKPSDSATAAAGSAQDRANQADALAGLYAQKFRSSFVGRFALSAIVAVAAALLVLLVPEAKAIAFGIEFAATITIVVSYSAATKGRWQEKWLEYRHLAEQLRLIADMPQAASCLLSRRQGHDQGARKWSEILIDRTARQALSARNTWPDNVVGTFDKALQNSLEGQTDYHRKNQSLMAKMERRLGRIGLLLFILSMTIASLAMVAAIAAPDIMDRISPIIAAMLAFFPACGAAIFAIRIQASFKTEAGRSKLILDRLDALSKDHQAGDRTSFRHVMMCARDFVSLHGDDVARWREIQAARALDLP